MRVQIGFQECYRARRTTRGLVLWLQDPCSTYATMDDREPPLTVEQEDQLTPDQAFKLATALLQKGHLEPAAEIYRRILAVLPDHADAHHYLAVTIYHLGQIADAVEHFQRAIAIDPAYADAYNNLGNLLRQQGRFEEAAEAYERALSLRPGNADSLNNMGTILRARGRIDEAIAMYRRAVERSPDHGEAHHNLATALMALDRGDEALEEFKKALLIRPYHAASYFRLGYAFSATGRVHDAAEVFRRWLALEPDNPQPRHLLSACTGEDVPPRASDDFVRQTFDAFAISFDQVLERLEYKAPALVAEAVSRLAVTEGQLDVLDVGCGTGLGGPLLRPFARRLVGMDLSERMLALARSRGTYDELVQAELTAFLEGHPATYDLVASIDTLVYFGDLVAAAAALKTALRPGGHAVFTLEKSEPSDGVAGFRLQPHGRYSHSESYVRGVLADAGLRAESLTEGILRFELQDPVVGFVVVAERPSANATQEGAQSNE